MADEKPTARFAGLDAALDCDACGAPFHVEGDVSTGETVTCSECGAELEVTGR